MEIPTDSLKRVGMMLGYGVLGVVITAATALVVLYVLQPLQSVIYDLYYLQVGPSEATEAAILVHFLVAGVAGLTVTMLAGDHLSDRGANRRTLTTAIVALLGLILLFLMVALAGLAAFLTALIVLTIGFVGIPLLLWYRKGVRSGAGPAFVGGIPVIVLLLLLVGFGLGWGWGYVMTAEEVPESVVNGTGANFDEVPTVRDAVLVNGDCETTTAGSQVCHMYLRGSAHEVAAARFMARNGVRCPYQNNGERSESFIAESNETFYRVTCSPHGD